MGEVAEFVLVTKSRYEQFKKLEKVSKEEELPTIENQPQLTDKQNSEKDLSETMNKNVNPPQLADKENANHPSEPNKVNDENNKETTSFFQDKSDNKIKVQKINLRKKEMKSVN